MKIAVISPKVPENIRDLIDVDKYVIYACDEAVEALIKQKITIDLAIGDFDSLNNLDLLNGIKTIKLNKIKDYSDTSYAIRYAYDKTDDVTLIGGIKGTRSDHFIANLFLMKEYPELVIMDETNKLIILNKGEFIIEKNDYKYLSIFPLKDSKISVMGTKYNLNNVDLPAYDPLGLSNEIIDSKATIKVDKGVVLLIQSK